MTYQPIYVVHRELGGGRQPWVVLECHPDRLAARVLAHCHEEPVALGIAATLSDQFGHAAYQAAVIDAEGPFAWVAEVVRR